MKLIQTLKVLHNRTLEGDKKIKSSLPSVLCWLIFKYFSSAKCLISKSTILRGIFQSERVYSKSLRKIYNFVWGIISHFYYDKLS